MNTHPVSAIILAATLCLSASIPLSAASQPDLPVAFHVQSVNVVSRGNMTIARGSDARDVFFAMKYKNRERLASGVWVFSDFHADSGAQIAQGCRSVVVTFENNRVIDLQLVNQSAKSSIAARLSGGSTGRSLASR
jgi:hypothetical protein